jgi:hypothetical protein
MLLCRPSVVVGGAQHHHQPRVGQRMRHGHEVVLPAHAADHLAALQRVAGRRAQQRHHHRGVHEARLGALRALQLGSPGWPYSWLMKSMRVMSMRASSCGGMLRSRS